MAILLFIVYLIFSAAAIGWCFRKKQRVVCGLFIAAFLAKVAAGMAYGYLHLNFYESDTAMYHRDSLELWQVLKNDPKHFFASLLHDEYAGGSLLDSQHSYFKHLEYHLLIRFLAFCNLFSGGHYYVNVIFYNLLGFCGHYLLFRFFQQKMPGKQWLCFLLIFFFPPLLFWVSGIHKDGFIFLGIAGLLYFFNRFLEYRKAASAIAAIFFLLVIFLFRNFLALVAVPSLLLWILTNYRKQQSVWIAAFFSIASIVFFFTTGLFQGGFNLPMQFATRQHDFLLLKGNSLLMMPALEPTVGGYLKLLPLALNHAFLRPFFTDGASPLILVYAAEVLLINLLIVGLIITKNCN